MTKKHDILWLDSIDSTNKYAKEHVSELDNLSVVSALTQTDGRGQRSNAWISRPGENLTFSVLLKYETLSIPAKEQILISTITAISVTELLSTYGISARVKWPNDIYVGKNKICGILIEHSVRGNRLSHSIIGIGLNINERNFDVSIPNPTSIAMILDLKEKIDTKECLEKFMDIYKKNLCLLNESRDYKRLLEISLSWQQSQQLDPQL